LPEPEVASVVGGEAGKRDPRVESVMAKGHAMNKIVITFSFMILELLKRFSI
jgi:hypothetical protein